tara:strand:+ start:7365 stop:7943 length:579 start_codon:yes stop_codon:yes gene_type:complete
LIKKIYLFFKIILISFFFVNVSYADLQNDLINKLISTETLSFDFNQKISKKEEMGSCFIKYPLLMRCNYKDSSKKKFISNGKTVAIIKRKYKKIYYYPLKSTPLFTILDKDKILNLIKKNKPVKVNPDIVEFIFIDSKSNKLKIFFNTNTLSLNGWETIDAYSNIVRFKISNLKINNQIVDSFFKIPKEDEL